MFYKYEMDAENTIMRLKNIFKYFFVFSMFFIVLLFLKLVDDEQIILAFISFGVYALIMFLFWVGYDYKITQLKLLYIISLNVCDESKTDKIHNKIEKFAKKEEEKKETE